MKQKKIGIITLLLLGIVTLRAQVSANAAGGDATGSGGSASYSIGQVAYTYVAGSNGFSNQGVQQPYEFFVMGINDYAGINLSISAFPNPTQAIVNLKVESPGFETLSFQLYDVSGRLLATQRISDALTPVPMQALASGAYLLSVSDGQKTLKTFKIIKNN